MLESINNSYTNTTYQIFINQHLNLKNTQTTTTVTKKDNLRRTKSQTMCKEDTKDHPKQYPKISDRDLITSEYTRGNTELCKALIRKVNYKTGSYDMIN